MGNEELLGIKKQILPNIQEIQEHHAALLSHHFHHIGLEKPYENIQDQTAFLTPNHLYKQKISLPKQKQNTSESLL